MCEECGCSEPSGSRRSLALDHSHAHGHDDAGLSHNDRLAERNRGFFRARSVFVVNLLSFSGSGARKFVQRTVTEYGKHHRIMAITGEWLEQVGAVHAHDTHAHDHARGAATADENLSLDAHTVGHALDHLENDLDVILIENGGSAASQAVYDLGETTRVALFSVRDGEFKPLKCPLLFDGRVSAVVINEMDQAAATGFNVAKAREHVVQVAPKAVVMEVAPATGEGMKAWYAFLDEGVKQIGKRKQAHAPKGHATGRGE
jgi:hydrogenase nickel incorporation protein HypB